MRRTLASVLGLVVAALALVLGARPAGAHPLGNFTTNLYSEIVVSEDAIEILHVIDLAEVPTFRADGAIDRDDDGTASPAELVAHAATVCDDQASALDVRLDDVRVPLRVDDARGRLSDGQAGLSTLRIECDLVAGTGGLGVLSVDDASFDGRLGWREIVVLGDGTTVTGDVRSESLSARLLAYPADRLSSPPDERQVLATVTAGGTALEPASPAGTVVSAVPGLDWATETLTGLVDDRALTVPFALTAVLVAMVLGSFHAVAPGHGKTVMAAYIVGQHGTTRQAIGLGATVAATHTAGVLTLGIVLSTSTALAPESLYPWLGLLSGALVAAIGAVLLVRAVRRRHSPLGATLGHHHGTGHHHHHHHHGDGGHTHAHDALVDELLATVPAGPAAADAAMASGDVATGVGVLTTSSVDGVPHDHGHHDDGHLHDGHIHDGHVHDHPDHAGHEHDRGEPAEDPGMTRTGIVAMGLAGGLVPSPSALVVLLGAIALGRAWFGVVVIAAYGVGMALTLVAAGLVMARLRDRIATVVSARPRASSAFGFLPVLTSGLVLGGGLLLAARAAQTF